MSHTEETCKTCGTVNWLTGRKCQNCYEVEAHLEDYMASPKGRDFVRNLLPKADNWPEWDYEAVLRANEATVEKDGDYWWTLGWRHGSMGINADDEVIARKSAAMFIELWLRGLTASFADNVAHGYAMWLELQNQRYSFELTKELGDAIIEMEAIAFSEGQGPRTPEQNAAWDKLVESAKLFKERDE